MFAYTLSFKDVLNITCMVVEPLAEPTPIVAYHIYVKVKTLDFGLPLLDGVEGPLAQEERRRTGRGAQALLRSGVTRVYPPYISIKWYPTYINKY